MTGGVLYPYRRFHWIVVMLAVSVPAWILLGIFDWRPIARTVLLWSGTAWGAVALALLLPALLAFFVGWFAGRRRGYRVGFQAGHRAYRVGGPY